MMRLTVPFLAAVFASSLAGQQNRPIGGNLRPAALRQNDAGRVDANFLIPAMTLYLNSSAEQRANLQQLLRYQQNPRSPLFHQWLTPEQFADRFGLSSADSQAIADWLTSQGFTVKKIARSRTWIAFSGTAGQAERAFHTEIHRYVFQGKSYFANATEPSMPAALAGMVSGVGGMDDYTLESTQPQFTSSFGHTLAPDDIATIYDISALYQAGIDGSGQKIAVMGTTVFDAAALADVAAFRSRYNLPANVPQMVTDSDAAPLGVTGETGEAHLDVEWAGAVARNAQIIFVAATTFLGAVRYTVDNNLAPVITMSANNGCEAQNNPAQMNFYQALAQQANAQGITWVNSGSDAGAASCDANGSGIAENGLGLRFPASIPEVTAVGGTEFDEQNGSYWNNANSASGASVAVLYSRDGVERFWRAQCVVGGRRRNQRLLPETGMAGGAGRSK